MERSEHHDSIIRTRFATRRIERGGHRRKGAGRPLEPALREDLRDPLRGGRALDIRRGDEPSVDSPAHRVDHAADVLVAEHREDPERLLGKTHVAKTFRESAGGVGIVSHVEHDARPPRERLEAPRQAHQREAALHLAQRDGQAPGELVERGERDRGILQLPASAQRRHGKRAMRALAPDEVPLAVLRLDAEIAAEQKEIRADRSSMPDQPLRRIRVSEDRGTRRPEDARLLETDRFAIRPEVGLMVDVHAHDRRHVGVDDVDGVEAPSEAHLEDRHLDLRIVEGIEGRQGAEFEIRERRRATRRLDAFEGSRQRFIGRLFAVQANALVVAKQMGRRVKPDTITRFEKDALHDGAGRSLAVGASHGDHDRRPREAHARGHFAQAVEPERDRRGMLRRDVFQPVVERAAAQASGTGSRFRSVTRRATLSRNCRRSTIMSIAPFSSRNSERWNPSGRVSRTVCSMTRGPANPMSAPGSAITTSPMNAKLAETPPMVGSVRIEMKGWRAAVSWCSAAVVFAICMSDRSPSCMRAPPVAVKQMKGNSSSQQACTARTKRSPTTEPIDPPRKPNSNAAAMSGTFLTDPCITTSASVSPVSFSASSSRSLYLRLSLNLSGSSGTTSDASSARPSESRKRSRRWRADRRL